MPNTIIACDVFKPELQSFGFKDASVHYLEMGLHDHPDLLRDHLQQLIEKVESDEKPDQIILFYGHCGGGTEGVFATKARLIVPIAYDCLSIFSGGNESYQQLRNNHSRAYFSSPGWLESKRIPGPDREASLRDTYRSKYDDDAMIDALVEVDRECFESYDTLIYFQTTADPTPLIYSQQCAQHMRWNHKSIDTNLSWIPELIDGKLDRSRVQVFEPGTPVTFNLTSSHIPLQS